MKPCPYRKEHEYDEENLCMHCYAKGPVPLPSPETAVSLDSSFVLPPFVVPANASLLTDPFGQQYWAWTDSQGFTHYQSVGVAP